MGDAELERMCNLAAEIFRVEKSRTLKASIVPFLSFLQWTTKAGPEQDSLKRAGFAWYMRAQKSAKLLTADDDIEEMSIEELEPMLSERVEKWASEFKAEGRVEGELKGRAEGKVEGQIDLVLSLIQMKFGSVSDELRTRIQASNETEIREICAKLLTADSIEAL